MQPGPARPLNPIAASPAGPAQPALPAHGGAASGLSEKQRQALGAAAVILCLVLGGGVIWWFFFGSSPVQRQVKVDPKEQSRGTLERRGPRAMREPRMIRTLADDKWLVRGSVGQMTVALKAGELELTDFRYAGGRKLSDEQMTLLSARWRILHDPALAMAWGITEYQKKKVEKLSGGGGAGGGGGARGGGGLDPSKEQRAALREAFGEFRRAGDGPARRDAQKRVLDQIDAVARGSLDASRKAYAERAGQIRDVLTPEQVRKILNR
jgi:hypothetical protein